MKLKCHKNITPKLAAHNMRDKHRSRYNGSLHLKYIYTKRKMSIAPHRNHRAPKIVKRKKGFMPSTIYLDHFFWSFLRRGPAPTYDPAAGRHVGRCVFVSSHLEEQCGQCQCSQNSFAPCHQQHIAFCGFRYLNLVSFLTQTKLLGFFFTAVVRILQTISTH